MSKTVILKIDQCGEQIYGPVKKFIGLLPPKSFNHLIDVIDLSANPRLANKGSVTEDIEKSLTETPELFPAKTKGILLAASGYKALERQRFQFEFDDPDTEGLLDGGHNALATGRFVLREAGVSQKDLKQVKDWESFASAWKTHRQAVAAAEDNLDLAVPVEIQVPSDMKDSDVVNDFKASLLDIGAARNNNVQLSDATKANKMGLYDCLKRYLPRDLADIVEWKANDGGRIKAQDILALSWIPLSRLDLPEGIRVNPNQIYRNKGVCVAAFNKLLGHKQVSDEVQGGYERKLNHPAIESALKIASDFPDLYDQIHAGFPDAYNKAGGSFGKISAVKMFDAERVSERNPKYLKERPTTPFFQREVDYTCPDGFIVPFAYGLRALISLRDDGLLEWKCDPREFLAKRYVDVMKSYRLAIELGQWDPQKVGKNMGAYEFAESAISAVVTRMR